MNKGLFIVLLGIITSLYAFRVVQPTIVEFDYPNDLPEPVYDFENNPLTEAGFVLGRKLFHDVELSRDGTISCASCHSQYNGFTHVDHNVSHGIEDRKGIRNSPVLINLAWNNTFHWDGGVNNLEMQPLNPIAHPAEMDNTLENILTKINEDNEYRTMFYNAFGDSTADTKKFLKALAQYTVSLVSANSKYDKYVRGDASFTEQEKNGFKLFKKHCNTCHTAPLFNSNKYASNGLPMDTAFNDVGRYKITTNPSDSLKFRIPTLRNIAYTFPYMHDGRFNKLKEVVAYYTSGIESDNPYLSPELRKKMKLSNRDQKDLIAFLLTLSDKEFLFNRRFSMPR